MESSSTETSEQQGVDERTAEDASVVKKTAKKARKEAQAECSSIDDSLAADENTRTSKKRKHSATGESDSPETAVTSMFHLWIIRL